VKTWYVKDIKTPQYFKRYQVKFRRRRSGKTDYRARKRLTTQDKNKYNSPKYRLAVRFSNRDICAQVIYATIAGDRVVASAYAHELPKYGLTCGLTNYAAAYCVGLLIARRTLTKYGLAEEYVGEEEPTGEDYNVEAGEGARPFKAFLDVGIKRTSTGAKVFGFLKGACDGGMDVPHNEKRFAGYDKDSKELDAETMQKYIMGGHVAEYMTDMLDEEPEKYNEHFKSYKDEGIEADDLEELYPKVHAAIRADPTHTKKERKMPAGAKSWKPKKMTYAEKKTALKAKLLAIKAGAESE
jgi:large subunit ribosomal protein L5e